MYSGKLLLTNPNGCDFSLRNDFIDVIELQENIEFECHNTENICDIVNRESIFRKWTIKSDNSRYTKLISVDRLGSIHYLLCYKL